MQKSWLWVSGPIPPPARSPELYRQDRPLQPLGPPPPPAAGEDTGLSKVPPAIYQTLER